MRFVHRTARVRVGVLTVLLLVIGLLAGGLAVAHRVRKQVTEERVRAAALTALDKEEWTEACRQLKLYLSHHPDDEALLERYAEANLAIRPVESAHLAAAVRAYRQLLQHRPEEAWIYARLCRLYFRLGALSEAAYVCRERLKAEPEDADAMLWLGRVLHAQQHFDEATEILATLVEKHPGQVDAYIYLSRMASRLASAAGRRAALTWLDRCVANNPQSAAARAHRARFHRMETQDERLAHVDLEAAEALNPTDPRVLLLVAEEWLCLGRLDRAEAAVNAIGRRADRSPDGLDLDSATIDLNRFAVAGRLALGRGDNAGAAALADNALEALPEAERGMFMPNAVGLYLAAGRIDRAEETAQLYRAAVEKQPDSTRALRRSAALVDAAVASAQNEPHRVIDLLRGLLVEDPDNPQASRLLARAYEQTGQLLRARRTLETRATLHPNDGEASLLLAKSYRAVDWPKTLQFAQQVERLLPDDLEAKLLRIEASLHTEPDNPGAQARLREVSDELVALRKVHPCSGKIHILQASLAEQAGRSEEAIRELRLAIESCGHELPVALALVSSLQRAGQLEEAVAVCRTAIENHPDSVRPRLVLADLRVAGGDTAAARDVLVEATGRLKGEEQVAGALALAAFDLSHGNPSAAVVLLEQIAAERTADARPRIALLAIREIKRDAERSQALVADLERIEGDAGPRWRIEQAKLWLRGQDWRHRQQDVADVLAPCLNIDAGGPTPALILGEMYARLSRPDLAQATYRAYLDSDPGNVMVADRLLGLLTGERRFVEAQTILDRVHDRMNLLRPHRVNVAIAQGRHPEAVSELESSVRSDPADAWSRLVLARLVYALEGDVERALILLDEAQAVAEDRLVIGDCRATILRSAGREDEALRILDNDVRRRGDVVAYMLRAKHLTASGAFERAEQDLKHLTTLEGSGATGHHLLGRFYGGRGRVDDAITAWQSGLEIEPENLALKTDLIRLLASGDAARQAAAKRLLTECIAGDPDNPSLLLLQATLLLNEPAPDARARAKALLEEVVRLAPRQESPHLLLIQLARADGDLAEARRLTDRAAKAHPGRPLILLAEADLERVSGRAPAARRLVRSVLDAQPDSIAALNLMARLDLAAGNLEAAIAGNDRALADAPADAGVQVVRSMILDAQGRRDAAIQGLESYLEEYPGRVARPAIILLAELHLESKHFDDARRRVEELEALSPNDRQAALLRLRVHSKEEDPDAMAILLDGLVASRPHDTSLLLTGVSLLGAFGRHEDLEMAKRVIDHVVRTDPTSEAGHSSLARLLYQMGDIEGAQRAYRKLIELQPYHAEALNGLAWILSEHKQDPASALVLANKALMVSPDDIHLLDTRGVVLWRLGRLDEAKTDFENCIEHARDAPRTRAEAWLHLGRLYITQGEQAQARESLRAASEIESEEHILSDAASEELGRLLKSVAP